MAGSRGHFVKLPLIISLFAQAAAPRIHVGPPPGFYACFIGWGVFTLIGGLFFHFNRNVRLKRRWLAIFSALVSGSFACLMVSGQGEDPKILPYSAFVLLFSLFFTLVNFALVRFCDQCGSTLYSKDTFFNDSHFCPHCDAPLHPDL
jgi:hypothetical protein